MLVALSVLLRLFAPFLPFVTEEVWSWWRPGSVHAARWPTNTEVLDQIGAPGPDPGALAAYVQSQAALAEVRRVRASVGRSAKAVIERAVLPLALEPLTPAQRDFTAATHIKELAFADVTEPELRFAEESQS
jgi:valyl-tRNA synthetase